MSYKPTSLYHGGVDVHHRNRVEPPGLGAPSPSEIMSMIPGAPQLLTYLRAEVQDSARDAVKPYVMASLAVGGVGALLGLIGLIVAVAKK